jgi:hypothetical protein
MTFGLNKDSISQHTINRGNNREITFAQSPLGSKYYNDFRHISNASKAVNSVESIFKPTTQFCEKEIIFDYREEKKTNQVNVLTQMEIRQKGSSEICVPPFKQAGRIDVIEECKGDARQRHLLEVKRGSRKFRKPSPGIVKRAKELEDLMQSILC